LLFIQLHQVDKGNPRILFLHDLHDTQTEAEQIVVYPLFQRLLVLLVALTDLTNNLSDFGSRWHGVQRVLFGYVLYQGQ
jgi:hypothetical protein